MQILQVVLYVVLGGVALFFLAGFILQIPAQHRFIDACGNKDPKKMLAFLDSGCDPNKKGWFGLTPLGTAILEKRLENVRLLLERGADATAKSGFWSVLHQAAEHNTLEIAELLLKAGADPNNATRLGVTPLLVACQEGYPDMARLLLQNGADPNQVSTIDGGNPQPLLAIIIGHGTTAKSHQKEQKLAEVVEVLLEGGANPNARTFEGAPMLGLALPSVKILRVLVDAGAITDVAWDGDNLKAVIESRLASGEG